MVSPRLLFFISFGRSHRGGGIYAEMLAVSSGRAPGVLPTLLSTGFLIKMRALVGSYNRFYLPCRWAFYVFILFVIELCFRFT